MKVSRNSLSCLIAALIIPAASVTTSAQVIPPAAKTAADATPHRKAIDDFVKAQIKKLTSGKSEMQTSGRDALEREGVAAGGASSSYLTVYADVVSTNLIPLASDKDVRNRLNAAIANSKVAAKNPSASLADVTVKFVNDPVEVVSMWGLKAAKFVVPAALQGNSPQSAALLGSISGAVKRFPSSGVVADEAYRALRVDSAGNVPNSIVQQIVPDMLAVLRARVGAYQKTLPGLPSADNQAVSFLALRGWGISNAAQQKEIVQLLSDLVSAQGQHIENMPGSTRNELLEAVRVSGGAFQVIGSNVKDPKVSDVGKSLQSVGVSTSGAEIRERADAIYPILLGNARFKGLKEPPKVDTTHDAAEEEPAKPAAATAKGDAAEAKGPGNVATPAEGDATTDEPAPAEPAAAPKSTGPVKAPAKAPKSAAK